MCVASFRRKACHETGCLPFAFDALRSLPQGLLRMFLGSFIISSMIYCYTEFHMDNPELINTLFDDKIAEKRKSNYPTHRVARLSIIPDEILDKLTPY